MMDFVEIKKMEIHDISGFPVIFIEDGGVAVRGGI